MSTPIPAPMTPLTTIPVAVAIPEAIVVIAPECLSFLTMIPGPFLSLHQICRASVSPFVWFLATAPKAKDVVEAATHVGQTRIQLSHKVRHCIAAVLNIPKERTEEDGNHDAGEGGNQGSKKLD